VQEQLDRLDGELLLRIEPAETMITTHRDWVHQIESTPQFLLAQGLSDHDPPHPASLTNALGSVEDDLIEMRRDHPELPTALTLRLSGSLARSLAQVEVGSSDIPARVDISREALEELFRTVATESTEDRAANPGLPPHHVELIVAAAVVAVGALRTLGLDLVQVV
jgi:exopolyphosphatase/pppGpp-phosphohydrolase